MSEWIGRIEQSDENEIQTKNVEHISTRENIILQGVQSSKVHHVQAFLSTHKPIYDGRERRNYLLPSTSLRLTWTQYRATRKQPPPPTKFLQNSLWLIIVIVDSITPNFMASIFSNGTSSNLINLSAVGTSS